MRRWLLGVGIALAAIVSGIYLLGINLPEQHSAELSADIAGARPEQVMDLIRDAAHYGRWRPGVTVTQVSRDASGLRFRESGPDGNLSYRQTESGSVIINEITGKDLPFGGKWTISVSPTPAGSHVRIREDGFVRPPLFRFMARFVFGYTRSMHKFLAQLAAAASGAPVG